MTRQSLRLRIFLLFALLAAGALAILLGALWYGYSRSGAAGDEARFLFAATVAGGALLALITGFWVIFDRTVAKPVQRLAVDLRTRVHGGVTDGINMTEARWLGDLAPAVQAVTDALKDTATLTADRIATATARLEAEKAHLTALLSEIPVATILADRSGRIVLYDSQAADVLSQLAVPRLGGMLHDYFDAADLRSARRRLDKQGTEIAGILRGHDGRQSYDIRLRPLDQGAVLLVIDAAHIDLRPEETRPLVFDFDLLGEKPEKTLADTPLRQLAYTVFDTETTGLLPHKDEIVQIGALRIVNGRIVPGEILDLLVDPGIPIPPASTAVHHVTDAMVAGQPDIREAGCRFHGFARDTVIVAHNAPFDMAFLRRHARRIGVTWDHPVLDTVLLSAVLFGTTEPQTLDSLCDRLDVSIPVHLRHTALGDARATAGLLLKMLPMLEAQGNDTFGTLVEQTRKHGRLLEDLN